MKPFAWVLLSLMIFTACEKDGDTIYLSNIEKSDFVATTSEVVLSQEEAAKVALSLAWTKNTLAISNPNMSAPDVLTTHIQVSTHNDFTSDVTESEESGLSKAYTGAELNTIVKNIGVQPNVATPVYFRLKARTGNNIEPVYSDIITVTITPYMIDMSIGFVLDSKKEDTGFTLSSPTSNGIYTGFMGASGWYNFFLLEGDGTIWGNDPVSGTPFLMSSGSSSWNFWFPGVTGCYYVIVDTQKKTWSSLLLPTLNVSGDINAEMTFDRPKVRWTTVFNATSASTLKIKLNTTGKQYDYATGTDDAAAVDTPVAFAQSGNVLALASQAEEISVTVPSAGEYTLVVDLSNPNAWTCEVISGSDEPEEVKQYLYLPGVDDAISGSWTFDNILKLYNEYELSYAGVVNVNSLWGYSINVEKDNWDDKYTMASGDAYSGSLEYKGENNLPAPDAGLYLADISLKELTYNLTNIGNSIYILGLDDKWEFNMPLSATTTAGVYTGTISFDSASPWGFSIHLINGDWDRKFGGSDGKLYYRGNNITDDASLTPGTYQMTVDLINETYSITQ